MKLSKLSILIFSILTLSFCYSNAATVDTLDIQSPAMNKTYKAAVVLPASYTKYKTTKYPVLYLLHGGSGHFRDWLTSTPDKMLVKNLADQYNLIIVMPEGETFGWYLDSPYDQTNKFETHIIKEVIPTIDNTYRTVQSKNGRVITGLSMGGHGAMYLSNRHPDMFCAVGTMSGAMDMNYTKFRVNDDFLKSLKDRFQKLLGSSDPTSEVFVNNSIINMTDAIKKNNLAVLIDCGVDDFLIEANRELHRRLVYNGMPHDYVERPGGHTWDYWQNALPYHLLFFQKVLKKNGVMVE
ncbi:MULTISPECIES: alpha/beta hydrolase family protein [unclassified Arcicella]|uniref:alpha/beta hydrolase n=1 Tax=unclassified Arcicella TaxID=2644986 RepID=UPI00285983BC|nr:MULTISPECIES: alpha/beta hydrolase family protein [unclassified Arcicella]MDR6563541.1 S-formylglutathione hydrolase FrmB [Arcicella sp. BE51]MDR6813347.1 S-formylglutathione hydrolase FrmB [Arcicella sp. BE140]MDR6824660.1 S-formylglutathione hydrolase FrmB [Arcicella sp. BE139]